MPENKGNTSYMQKIQNRRQLPSATKLETTQVRLRRGRFQHADFVVGRVLLMNGILHKRRPPSSAPLRHLKRPRRGRKEKAGLSQDTSNRKMWRTIGGDPQRIGRVDGRRSRDSMAEEDERTRRKERGRELASPLKNFRSAFIALGLLDRDQ